MFTDYQTEWIIYWCVVRVKAVIVIIIIDLFISPDKARKGVIYPLKTGIFALVGISERTSTR